MNSVHAETTNCETLPLILRPNSTLMRIKLILLIHTMLGSSEAYSHLVRFPNPLYEVKSVGESDSLPSTATEWNCDVLGPLLISVHPVGSEKYNTFHREIQKITPKWKPYCDVLGPLLISVHHWPEANIKCQQRRRGESHFFDLT